MKKTINFIITGAMCLGISAPISINASELQKKPAKVENLGKPAKIKKQKQRSIKNVSPIRVESPVGTVPRLPWQVWVTYSDGSHEWRQAKWENYMRATEQAEADPQRNLVGSEYTIEGYIIGDNTTNKGYPLVATVVVTNNKWDTPNCHPVANPLKLTEVSINGKNRLTNNRNLNIKTLLSWDITQQLYNYRDTYGLPTDGYTVADGWDSPTTKLKGHGSGHYMSSLAFAFASCNPNEETAEKTELRKRIKRMVDELRACQERTFVWDSTLNRYREARDYAPEEVLMKMGGSWADFDRYKKDYRNYGYGYLNAIPAAHPALIEKYAPYNNEEGVWAPYYTIHKQLAGLIDIANNIDDKEIAAKALLIAKDMGLWVWNRMHYRTYVKADGDKAQRQAKPGNRYEMWNMYIAGEVGGMAESLARLSEMVDSKDEKEKLLEAANCFDTPALFNPLAANIDDIRTRHANQHIPMITGALRSFIGNCNPYYYNIAYNFWNMMQGKYVYAMGSVGNGEMFRQPYSQILSMNTNVMSDSKRDMYPNPDINETCCAYNLAKLTKDLNCFNPDNAEYMDYYERVLYNQIIGSLHPEHWAVTYQYAVGMNSIKPYGNNTPQSTCCGGTGAENHVKYQEAAYFVNDNTMWVGLYMPTTARWEAKGVTIEQECEWPAQHSMLTIRTNGKATADFTLKLRVPYWATKGFDIKLNGKSIAKSYLPCSYAAISNHIWKDGDRVEVCMPFTKHVNWGPDKMDLAATGKNEVRTPFSPQWVGTIMYGPMVMATKDIKEWKNADITLSSTLNEITLKDDGATDGTNDKLYTLQMQTPDNRTITFTPDYYQTDHSTHYLRIDMQTGAKKLVAKGVDKTLLEQALAIAKERMDNQKAWEAMSVKVPAFAPWAPNGYARLCQQVKAAEAINALDKKNLTQAKVDEVVSALNVAINTMRPGNLAEPEDLNKLLSLLTNAKNIQNKTTELREAIDYADMVVQYVNDGSGTHDLIEKAINKFGAVKK